MKPLDRLSEYLGVVERRLRLLALTRGAAVTAAAALLLTVAAVLVANEFAFSGNSVMGARLLLFLGLAAALAAAVIIPLIRLNRRHAAQRAESRYPQFEERLLTFTERVEKTPNDPFLELLADDALSVAQQASPQEVAKTAWMFSFSSGALVFALALIWLGVSGPGYWGYGTSLLWGGIPKGVMKPYYSIRVDPGNKTIRKRSDQLISATLMGFTAPKVRIFAKYSSSSQWEQAEMRTAMGGSDYQFLIAGVPESMDYYIEAGGVRSDIYKLNVLDLPVVKKIRVTYHYPAWTHLKDMVEDPGGDLHAVEGTTAQVAIATDKPLANGAIFLDDGSKINLRSGADGMLLADIPIQRDGMYHVAAVEGGEDVRLGEDYLIDVQKYQPPEVKITRPGRDFRASPIEEVTVSVDAKDDFGLADVVLHYAVNGGPDKTVSLLANKGAKTASGSTVIALEDYKVVPGDVVAIYAEAKDARSSTSTDMFFIQAEPFERNYTQSQQDGGGGMGGDDANQQNELSEREKEMITATWNQAKGQGAKGTDQENANFLASVQGKLREQAKSLSDRAKARQLEGAGDSFKSFVDDMDAAVEAMGPAVDKLKGAKWQDALVPEQKALQHLLRAEATFRDIQVSFGQQGGGGGGGGMNGATRDLQGLFDLEMDTEKNQYESARTNQAADARQQQIDDAFQKLKDIARRQQELAEQQKNQPQTTTQRWQQEMLRREAEKLQQELQQLTRQSEQLSRNGQQSGQQGQQGQQSQSQQGQQGQSGQQGQQGQQGQAGQSGQMGGQMGQQQQQQSGQMNQQGQPQSAQQQAQQRMQQMMQQQNQAAGVRGADPRQLQQILDSLTQAMQDMQQAGSSQQAGTPAGAAEARRAAERLNDATRQMEGLQSAQANNEVESLAHQADELARRQQDFEGQLRKAFGPDSRGVSRDQAEQFGTQRDGELNDLKNLEKGMQNAVRNLQGTERAASGKMREALGQMEQQDISRDMQRNADWIRRGMGEYAVMSESQITAGLNDLRDRLKAVQQAMGKGQDPKAAEQDKALAQGLKNVEGLRQAFQQMTGPGNRGQQPGPLSRNGQQPGQQGQNGQQPGQQPGQNGQQGQQGQQANGQQPGQNGQQGGQQAGQQGGQQGSQGNQQGMQQANGNPGPLSGGGGRTYGGSYLNNGNDWGGPINDPRGWAGDPVYQQAYRDTLQSLGQLQQQLKDDSTTTRDIQGLMRDLRALDPVGYSNDPLLQQRIQAALSGLEQVEMELRRKADATGEDNGAVRSPGNEMVPQGYQDAVARYFRDLSKAKDKDKEQH